MTIDQPALFDLFPCLSGFTNNFEEQHHDGYRPRSTPLGLLSPQSDRAKVDSIGLEDPITLDASGGVL
jgi:hypothetical protein